MTQNKRSARTLVVLDNNFEYRYYRSAKTVLTGIGYAFRGLRVGGTPTPDSRLLVYRLDEEASDSLNREAYPHFPPHGHSPEKNQTLVALLKRLFS